MKPKASERVTKALESDWTPACDGLVAAHWFSFDTGRGRGAHRILKVLAGEREIEVVLSPTGRSVRVHVDGEEA